MSKLALNSSASGVDQDNAKKSFEDAFGLSLDRPNTRPKTLVALCEES
jgi:hypothetical protein